MTLADLLDKMDAHEVSLVSLQRFKRTDIGAFYRAIIGHTQGPSFSTCSGEGPSREEALEAAMNASGLFIQKRVRTLEELLG